MASFFKASCAVYWLTWLFCLAYLMGTSLYTDRFIYADTADARNIRDYIFYLCVFNICYSFVGCVFVKCNITHILYAVLFVFPMLGVNFTFSVMGLLTSKTTSDKFPTPREIIENAQNFFKEHNNQYPTWLYHTQENANCCGILSYLDFPAFLYTEATVLLDAIPQSCCYDSRNKSCVDAFKLSHHPNATQVTIESIYAQRVNRCHNHAEWIQKELTNDAFPKIKNTNTFYLLEKMTPILPTCGCYTVLKDSYATLFGTAHFIFFIAILILTAVMLFVYVKNWCNNRGIDSGSDHSLDTDSMSLLNLKLPLGDGKDHSAGTVPEKSIAKTNVKS